MMNAPTKIFGAGGGGGGKSGGGVRSDDNSLFANSTGDLLMVLGEGPVKACAVGGLKGLYLDGTRVMNDAGEIAIKGVSLFTREGYPTQTAISDFDGVSTVISVGTRVYHANPITRNLTNPYFTSCVVTMRFPALVQNTDKGLKKTSVQFKIEARYDGGAWVNPFGVITVDGKQTSAYEEQYQFRLPLNPSGDSSPWSIQITRLTDDHESDDIADETWLATLTGIIDTNLSYPDTALIGLRFDAKEFSGSIPTVEVVADGLLLQVPTNYNPDTRTYSGIWDGTFKTAFSNNPAWFFYTVATNKRFGAGKFIKPQSVDKWSLYAISQVCDELVSDGYGGLEPRFTVNAYITEEEELYDMMQLIASAFRGMSYWSSGAVTATQDTLTDAVIPVNRSNVINGLFSYSSSSLTARHTVVQIKYKDKNDEYRDAVEVVRDQKAILRYGERVKEIDGFGCTSRAMAHRLGQWILLTEIYETETVTYQAGLDHAVRRPGDIVAIMDPEKSGVDFGGRLGSGNSASSLTLDRPLPFEAGKDYAIHVVLPDGSLVSRPIVNPGATASTVTLTSPLPDTPLDAAVWIISSSDVEPKPYRIISISEREANIYEVTALEVYRPKYGLIDATLNLDEPNYRTSPVQPDKPSNLSAKEALYASNGVVRTQLMFSWSAPRSAYAPLFRIEIDTPDAQNEVVISSLSEASYVLSDAKAGDYTIRVYTLSLTSPQRSQAASYTFRALGAENFAPGDVQSFNIAVLGDISTLSWDPVTTPNVSHYVIRYSPAISGVTWGSAAVLLPHITSTSAQIPTRAGTYLIKALNAAGVESQNALLIISSVQGSIRNVVDLFDEAPGWTGTKEGVIAHDGDLRLESADTLEDWTSLSAVPSLAFGVNGYVPDGLYTSELTLDLGEVYTSRVIPEFNAFGKNSNNILSSWTSLAEVESLGGADPSSWAVTMLIKTTNDDPAGSPVWSDWRVATVSDVSARAYQMRLHLESPFHYITPVVITAKLTVDMPDRIISGNDALVPASGLRIDFVPALKKLSGFSISAQGLATGDYYQITDKDETGFFVEFKNSAGTSISKVFDYVATGYGRQA